MKVLGEQKFKKLDIDFLQIKKQLYYSPSLWGIYGQEITWYGFEH